MHMAWIFILSIHQLKYSTLSFPKTDSKNQPYHSILSKSNFKKLSEVWLEILWGMIGIFIITFLIKKSFTVNSGLHYSVKIIWPSQFQNTIFKAYWNKIEKLYHKSQLLSIIFHKYISIVHHRIT